jgi:hypothetical protein
MLQIQRTSDFWSVCLRFCVDWLDASYQTCLKKEPRRKLSGAQVSDNYVTLAFETIYCVLFYVLYSRTLWNAYVLYDRSLSKHIRASSCLIETLFEANEAWVGQMHCCTWWDDEVIHEEQQQEHNYDFPPQQHRFWIFIKVNTGVYKMQIKRSRKNHEISREIPNLINFSRQTS